MSVRLFRRPFFHAAFLFIAAIFAANTANATLHDDLLREAENFVRETLQNPSGLKEVVAGPIDPRLRLPPCTSFQSYLPNNMDASRLFGQTQIGVRCLSPSRWNIYIPVKIAIERSYLAAASTLPAGRVLQSGDWTARIADVASLPASVVSDPQEAIGKTLRVTLQAGQPLRTEQLVAPLIIQQGQTVRMVFRSEKFSASNEGKALKSASVGQVVQARTASGVVVTGIAQADGTILVSPQ